MVMSVASSDALNAHFQAEALKQASSGGNG